MKNSIKNPDPNRIRRSFKVSDRKTKPVMRAKPARVAPCRSLVMNPVLWKKVRGMVKGDFSRVEFISETEVIIHNSSRR